MKVRTDDARPAYRQIADDIRAQIEAGGLRSGQRLKPAKALAAEYGVAPMTIQVAIRELKGAGLVESFGTRGVFVSSPDNGADAVPESGVSLPDVVTEVQTLRAEMRDLAERLGRVEAAVQPTDSKSSRRASRSR
jgi:GntR family transcriptional regulator